MTESLGIGNKSVSFPQIADRKKRGHLLRAFISKQTWKTSPRSGRIISPVYALGRRNVAFYFGMIDSNKVGAMHPPTQSRPSQNI